MTLKDLPDEALDARDYMTAFLAGGDFKPQRVDTGVYLSHFNWNHDIAEYIEDSYEGPYDDPRPEYDKDPEAWGAWLRDTTFNKPHGYGVCDNWQQIVERWPELLTDPRPVIISLTPVFKAHQSPEGDWRWHKWGEYIGTHEIKHEYLYDEEDIEVVYCYHICRLKVER